MSWEKLATKQSAYSKRHKCIMKWVYKPIPEDSAYTDRGG